MIFMNLCIKMILKKCKYKISTTIKTTTTTNNNNNNNNKGLIILKERLKIYRKIANEGYVVIKMKQSSNK